MSATLRVRAKTKNSNTMSGPNNISNDYNNICQSSFPEDFNFDSPINMAINLQAQPHTQGFRPSTAFPLSRNVSTNTMDYGNIGNYTGDYASYQGNPPDTDPGITNHDQTEACANSSCSLQGSFQTYCGSFNPYSDTTNDGPTDNHSQHSDVANNTYVSYSLMQMPTSNEYVVIREERTQSVLGRLSAAAIIDEMFALTRM